MRKLFILSLVALLCMAGVSFARVGDSRIGVLNTESTMIFNVEGGHVHLTTKAADIYGITLLAEAITTYLQLYDTSGMGAASSMEAHINAIVGNTAGYGINKPTDYLSTKVKADLIVSTAGDITEFTFDPPLHFEHGILAGFVDSTNAPTSQDLTHATIRWAPSPE